MVHTAHLCALEDEPSGKYLGSTVLHGGKSVYLWDTKRQGQKGNGCTLRNGADTRVGVVPAPAHRQGGPADEAGLQKGDIIMRWDENPVTSKVLPANTLLSQPVDPWAWCWRLERCVCVCGGGGGGVFRPAPSS